MKQIDFKVLLPDWTLEINETSNNVYHFIGISPYGNKSELTDSDYDNGYLRCLEGAIEIELSNNDDNKFLYDIFFRLIEIDKEVEKKYEYMAFGSWYIQSNQCRLIFEGRDYDLRLESKVNKEWLSEYSINTRKRIKLSEIKKIINKFK